MTAPEVSLERYIHEKRSRREAKYAHIVGRIPVEDLPSDLHRWLVDWMNRQLSDVRINSKDGCALPPLHFDLLEVNDNKPRAHVFETDEFGFIVVTQPMVDEMQKLSILLVVQNFIFINSKIAPYAICEDIVRLLLLMQFCLVASHEWSHLARRHSEEDQPDEADIDEWLGQAQELDADGYGIYHDLQYFFNGGGRLIASQLLRISDEKALQNSILSCFLLSIMTQFCARWAGKIQIEPDASTEHPPWPLRIEYSMLIVEMWCREVSGISTSWMTDGTRNTYFSMVAKLFPQNAKAGWDQQISWLRSPLSEKYQNHIRRSFDRIRTQ